MSAELIIGERQTGRTTALVEILYNKLDAVLVCTDHRMVEHTRRMLNERIDRDLTEGFEYAGRRDRIFSVTAFRKRPPSSGEFVMVDDADIIIADALARLPDVIAITGTIVQVLP